MDYRNWLLMTVFFLIAITGCSKGAGLTSPIPGNDISQITLPDSVGVLVEDVNSNGLPNGMGMLGVFQAFINTDDLNGELIPLRESTLDDALEIVDITNFLSLAPCSDCAKLMSIELDTGSNLLLKIGIKHPFAVGDPLKPISGQNRADLHVFNVEGTVVFDDTSGSTQFVGLGDTLGPAYLVNADGYSPYLDTPLDDIFPTNATIHPYILHFDDYTAGNFDPASATGFTSVVDPPPSGNLVMPMGSDYDIQDYVFKISAGESLDFILAIGCSYAVSAASKNDRFTPEYQVPQHNKKAASEVSVEIITNDLADGDTGSTADLEIKVLDINHGIAIGAGLDEMKADSSVAAISVEIPQVTSGVVTGSPTPTGGDGRDPANPLIFPVTVQNDLGAAEGFYTGLVKVTDAYAPGSNESPLLTGMDGIKRVAPTSNPLEGLFQISEFASYASFEIEVTISNTPPIAMICTDQIYVCGGSGTTINASGSTDLEDDLAMIPLNFEFDDDYDGVNFNSDSGPPSTDSVYQTSAYSAPGPYTAAVRVTDSGNMTDIATVSINIGNTPTACDWSSDVTDPTQIQNTRYFHTRDDLQETQDRRAYGLEGTAYGNGYVYLTFYTGGGSIYFTRSADSGMNWDTPTEIVSGLSNIVGCAIAAVDSEVFIIYGESATASVNLLKNTNSGDGSWDEYVIGSYAAGMRLSNIGVAVDPTDTNYVYAVMIRDEDYDWFIGHYFLANSTGGSGSWSEQYNYFSPQPNNGCQLDLGVNSDGSVYVLHMSNTYIGVTRSDNHGVTFTSWSGNYIWTHYWGGEADMCFDPNNPDVIYFVWSTMGTNPPYGYRTVRLARSTNRANSFSEIQTNLIHVTDVNGRQPAVMMDSLGKLFITYSYQSAIDDFDIFVRSSCDDGISFSSEVKVNSDDDGFDVDSELVISPAGGIVVTYEENGYLDLYGGGNDNPDGKIVARHLL